MKPPGNYWKFPYANMLWRACADLLDNGIPAVFNPPLTAPGPPACFGLASLRPGLNQDGIFEGTRLARMDASGFSAAEVSLVRHCGVPRPGKIKFEPAQSNEGG
jgi:hypothetical protein